MKLRHVRAVAVFGIAIFALTGARGSHGASCGGSSHSSGSGSSSSSGGSTGGSHDSDSTGGSTSSSGGTSVTGGSSSNKTERDIKIDACKLDDAGKMWAITAKEGYPTAQRELALFYLSNPEFVERTTVPLSKPREVFKQVVMEKYGRSERARGSVGALNAGVMGGSGGGMRPQGASAGSADGPPIGATEGDVRNDAGIMCVAVHWMEAAEQGGDELASSFLRQNEFAGLP